MIWLISNFKKRFLYLHRPAYTIKHGFENKAYQPNKNSPLDPSNNKKQLLSAVSTYKKYSYTLHWRKNMFFSQVKGFVEEK